MNAGIWHLEQSEYQAEESYGDDNTLYKQRRDDAANTNMSLKAGEKEDIDKKLRLRNDPNNLQRLKT